MCASILVLFQKCSPLVMWGPGNELIELVEPTELEESDVGGSAEESHEVPKASLPNQIRKTGL